MLIILRDILKDPIYISVYKNIQDNRHFDA